jgi:hypothetical protein
LSLLAPPLMCMASCTRVGDGGCVEQDQTPTGTRILSLVVHLLPKEVERDQRGCAVLLASEDNSLLCMIDMGSRHRVLLWFAGGLVWMHGGVGWQGCEDMHVP